MTGPCGLDESESRLRPENRRATSASDDSPGPSGRGRVASMIRAAVCSGAGELGPISGLMMPKVASTCEENVLSSEAIADAVAWGLESVPGPVLSLLQAAASAKAAQAGYCHNWETRIGILLVTTQTSDQPISPPPSRRPVVS